jgi:DNA helicase-2/ATP-dependent DNA helicase PcrA
MVDQSQDQSSDRPNDGKGEPPSEVVREELAALETVLSRLAEIPPTRTASEAPIVRELERLRERLLSGDENKDLSALTEQYHNQSAILNQLRRAGPTAKVDPASPYFAHLRLEEEGRRRDLFLGRATCLEKGVRIVDWRDAPISKVFYSYRQGEEFDEEISGRERQGIVLARRMVRVRDGVLERVQAPEGDFTLDAREPSGWRESSLGTPRLAGGESAALRFGEADELLRSRRMGEDHDGEPLRADKHLPEITSLIDPTQFDLITRPASGYLVIRGSAGSGKTTVALHRIAYLAYADPRIDGPETLVVVFSRALARYVDHVLPSLGLDHVRIVTYREWVREERRRHYPHLPGGARDDTPALVQRLKLHSGLEVALQRQVARVPGPRSMEQAMDDWASVLTQRALLGTVFAEVAPGQFSERDLDRFVDWNRRRLEELGLAIAGEADADGALDPEDDALLLRAWQLRIGRLLGRSQRPLSYRHVVIDEVQDFAPLEVRVLLETLQRDASITLAGDTQQHLVEHSGFTSWASFFEALGIDGAEIETLRVSYRSSSQIMEFATSLLGDLQEDEEIVTTRSGPPVELFRLTDRGACVAFLADVLRDLMSHEPMASVAVLTPSPTASDLYYAGLERAELPRLRRIRDGEFPFKAGIEVTEVAQVKGLEFDYVVVLDVDSTNYPDKPAARRMLHVAATRAVHQLWMMSVGTPSPLVEAVESR